MEMMAGDFLPDALRYRPGKFCPGVGQHNYKFVTSIACDSIGIANGRQNNGRHLHENVRADEVTVHVIDSLEIIKIKKQCRNA